MKHDIDASTCEAQSETYISDSLEPPSRDSLQPAVIEKLVEIQLAQRRPGYWASNEDLDLLEYLVLEEMEPFCSELIPRGYPSDNEEYWIWREHGKTFNVSLTTGRFFLEETGDKGAGDVFLLWRTFKNVSFVDTLTGITDWLLKRYGVNSTGTPRKLDLYVSIGEDDLRRLVWYAIDKTGKRSYEECSRAFWKIVRAECGETACARIRQFSSPKRFRALLTYWAGLTDRLVGTGITTPLFTIAEKRWETPNQKRNRVTIRVAYCLTRSGVPCSHPPESEAYRQLGIAIPPE